MPRHLNAHSLAPAHNNNNHHHPITITHIYVITFSVLSNRNQSFFFFCEREREMDLARRAKETQAPSGTVVKSKIHFGTCATRREALALIHDE